MIVSSSFILDTNYAEAKGPDEPCSYLNDNYLKISYNEATRKAVCQTTEQVFGIDFPVPDKCGRIAGLYLTDKSCQPPPPPQAEAEVTAQAEQQTAERIAAAAAAAESEARIAEAEAAAKIAEAEAAARIAEAEAAAKTAEEAHTAQVDPPTISDSDENFLFFIIIAIIIILIGISLAIFVIRKIPPRQVKPKPELEPTPEPRQRKFFTSDKLLDPDQISAVQYPYDKPLIVRAGPGSGKTRVVKERIKDIILEQDVSANRILCLSFSKAAQQTMLERFQEDSDLKEYAKSIGDRNVRTIHSLGKEISGSKELMKPDDPEMEQFQSKIRSSDYPLISAKHPENDEGYPDFRKVLHDGVSTWKKESLKLDALHNYIEDLTDERKKNKNKDKEIELSGKIDQYRELYKHFEKYEEFLASKGKIDFDDMVLNSIKKLKENPTMLESWGSRYDHVIVDEFQDNNYLQTELARLLSPNGHITAVGDEDQCIYTFQGAHVENFENLREHYSRYNPEEKILRTNYRSTEEIVEKSQQLMNAEKGRQEKDLKAFEDNGRGITPELHAFDTAEKEFLFIKNKIIQLNEISRISLEDCVVLFRKNKQVVEFKKFWKDCPIKTSNIHQVKGKEFSIVFISHVEDGSIPLTYQEAELVVPRKLQKIDSSEDDSIAHEKEERRVFYVGMTRAKKQLFLTYHTDKSTTRSKFLNDITIKPQ